MEVKKKKKQHPIPSAKSSLANNDGNDVAKPAKIDDVAVHADNAEALMGTRPLKEHNNDIDPVDETKLRFFSAFQVLYADNAGVTLCHPYVSA